MTLTIKTNGIPRPVIESHELTAQERKEFDYIDWEQIDKGNNSASFFRYMGQLYDLGEFTRCVKGGEFANKGWDGQASDTMFSCVLIRFRRNMEYVVVGRAYS